MLRVVYIITTVDGYGADKSIINNLIYLKKEMFVDPFVVIPSGGYIEDQLRSNNIKYEICNFKSWFKGPSWLVNNRVKRESKSLFNRIKAYLLSKRLLKNGIFDIVHTNTMTTNFGIYLSEYLKSKHVMHIRELPTETFHFEYEYGEEDTCRMVMKGTHSIIANSEYVARKFRQYYYLHNVHVIHNGVFSVVPPQNPNAYDFSEGVRVVIAGRLQEDKGQMTALKAMFILKQRGYSNIYLDVYGDGELKVVFANFIKKNEIGHIVKMIPYVADLDVRLKNYHIGLVCTRCESFGRATVEYMGNGLAVIGNDTGYTPLLIKDKVNGLITKFDDENGLAEKICMLVSDKTLIEKCGHKAFESVRKGFSVGESSLKLMAVYTETMV